MAAAVKVGEVRSLLERFDDTLEANSVDQAAIGALRNLCGMFTGSEEKTLASFLTAAGCAPLPAATGGGALIGSVVPMLESLLTLLSGVAKKDLLKSLDSLLDILRAKADASITVFVAAVQEHVASASQPKRKRGRGADPMDETLIDDYVRRLEAALGNDSRFKLLFEELRADQRITQREAVSIASRFYGRTPARTSRPKAFGRIWERHENLMTFTRQSTTARHPAA